MYYPNTESNPNFSNIEAEILAYWQEHDIFEKSIAMRHSVKDGKNNEFVFYDGPPFANGLPHYGHILTSFIKDVFARYQTIKGKKVARRFGWDCHGLPAEMGAEKELNISGRTQITEFGIDKFNAHCRKSVLKYTQEWEEYITKAARWVDFKNPYKTMDTSYMESVIWAFKELYNKGLIYQNMRVMPYSWACQTPLSNFETRMDNSYRERADKAITVAFTLKEKLVDSLEHCKAYKILAWTTTPWTLPANLALAINVNIVYALVPVGDICYIIAKSSLAHYKNELKIADNNYQEISGASLIGLAYEPLFSYFKGHKNSFKILAADFVVEGEGTGVVHLAPGFGEDDQIACNNNHIELVCPVDNAGKFTEIVTDFAQMQVFEAIDPIIIHLKSQNSWLKTEQYIHNYPHCWRTDTPLIFKAVPSWYVEVTKFRHNMSKNNQQINWLPSHIRDGLFGKWLENAKDWSISRNRFWGTPIPVWKSDSQAYPRIDVYGSIAELEADFKVKITDLHRPFIDDLVRANPDDPTGKSMMHRVSDVFDCWFESGAMPFAQLHYPFENKEHFENNFPADFIVEYVAQTRGWFYTLLVLSTALFDRPPFLNCICHGVILDERGQKLSKRLNNFADPKEIFSQYSSDALRFLMMSSSVMRGNELLIDQEGKMVRDVLRLHLKPIWNAYNFFTLYANADKIKAHYQLSYTNLLDQYIITKTKQAVEKISQALDEFETIDACNAIVVFFEILTNWYIRRNRSRFWKTQQDQDKQDAYNCLYSVLYIMCRASSPLLPLLCEQIYLGLSGVGGKTSEHSVHLADFPDVSAINLNWQLADDMDRVREIASLALAIRSEENIRVRMPLQKVTIMGKQVVHLVDYAELIKDEINVKEVIFVEHLHDLASTKLQVNFPLVGKRIPSKVKEIIIASKAASWSANADGSINIANEQLSKEEAVVILEPKNNKGIKILSSHDALVMLDLNLSQELQDEGIARDIVRLIQQTRKECDLKVWDKISLAITGNKMLEQIVQDFSQYIKEQTLADEIHTSLEKSYSFVRKANIDAEEIMIAFSLIDSV
jgi:isoleucyl-tRNA synthetase